MKEEKPSIMLVRVPDTIREALRVVHREHLPEGDDPALTLDTVLLAALANWHLIGPHIKSLQKYCEMEGENRVEMFHRSIRQQFRLKPRRAN